MPNPTMEQRVAALEQQVAELKAQERDGREQKPWPRVLGMFAGDEGMKEIFDEALKLREQERPPSHQKSRQAPNQTALVLDTAHLTVCAFPESDKYQSLSARIRQAHEQFATPIVCLEEQLRGWLAAIKRKQDPSDQVAVYRRRWFSSPRRQRAAARHY